MQAFSSTTWSEERKQWMVTRLQNYHNEFMGPDKGFSGTSLDFVEGFAAAIREAEEEVDILGTDDEDEELVNVEERNSLQHNRDPAEQELAGLFQELFSDSSEEIAGGHRADSVDGSFDGTSEVTAEGELREISEEQSVSDETVSLPAKRRKVGNSTSRGQRSNLPEEPKFDLIAAIAAHSDLAIELGKQLHPRDILHLYSISKAFHRRVRDHLLSCLKTWVGYMAPEAGRLFHFRLYRTKVLILDPLGRTNAWADGRAGEDSERGRQIRMIPSMRWFQMVVGRNRYAAEIKAILARHGFRFPDSMTTTLMKLWLLLEVSTNKARVAMMRSRELWGDFDLYNLQMFVVKLSMLFNDPVYGPSSHGMMHLIMGQKGLFPLWQILFGKKYRDLPSLLEMKARYDYPMPRHIAHWGVTVEDAQIHGVPVYEVGKGHLEGWGKGRVHLARPDELVIHMAVEREIELSDHIIHFILWGYFDWKTGENLVPTEEEMYIEDETEKLQNVDTTAMWKPKHAKKKRWASLTREEKAAIFAQEEDDKLRALEWAEAGEPVIRADDIAVWDHRGDTFGTVNLDAEIDRGYVMESDPSLSTLKRALSDNETVAEYVQRALFGGETTIVQDKILRGLIDSEVPENALDYDWNTFREDSQQDYEKIEDPFGLSEIESFDGGYSESLSVPESDGSNTGDGPLSPASNVGSEDQDLDWVEPED
jgi:hypothetical protein